MQSGGDVWFPTLTYNDESLFWYVDDDYDFECQGVDSDRIHNFYAHVRMNLSRMRRPDGSKKYPDTKEIRFEIVTEYGGEKGRLHHHALVFSPFHIEEPDMVDALELAWAYRLEPITYEYTLTRGKRKGTVIRKQYKGNDADVYQNAFNVLVERYGDVSLAVAHMYARTSKTGVIYYYDKQPKNGFVMWSPLGLRISGAKGIRYVQKYITKPQAWIKEYGIEEYEKRLKDDVFFWSNASARCDKGLFQQDVHAALVKEVRDRGEFWRVDSQFAHAYHHLQKVVDLSELPQSDYVSYRLDRACDKLRTFRRCKPKHFQSTSFGVDAVDYYKNPDGTWNIDALVDGRINLGDTSKYGQFAFIDAKHPNFRYNMPTYIVNKIFKTVDEYGLYQKNHLYDEVFEKRYQDCVKRQVEAYLPYLQTEQAFAAHVAPVSNPVSAHNAFKEIQTLMRGRSPYDLVMFEQVYQDRFYEDGMKQIIDEIVAPAGFRASHYDGLNGIDLLRAVALPFLHLSHHTEFLTTPAPERFKNRSMRRKREFALMFDDIPEFYGFSEVLATIHAYEERLGALKDAASRLKLEQTAKIMSMVKHARKMSKNSQIIYAYGK